MRIILLLALLTAFPAMSMDMYLPALPTIQNIWNASMSEANLTLSIFMVTIAIVVLIYGPLSDRFGRRPVLLIGLLIYFAGCISCALAPSIQFLIAARCVQAAGAGCAMSLTMAIARDLFVGDERQKVLGYVGVVFALVPMLAPTVGGFMLSELSWRWIFGVQAVLSCGAVVSVFRLGETNRQLTSGGGLAIAKRYLKLFRNGSFVALTVLFALMACPLFAYIGSAAEIYINEFGLTPQTFGLHFGLIAGGIMAGSMFTSRMAGKLTKNQLLAISLSGLIIAGATMFLVAPSSPFELTPIMLCAMCCVGINRPLSMHMVLDTVETDAGAASSLLTFSMMVTGGVTMSLVSLDWGSRVPVLNTFLLVGTVIPIIGLLLLRLRRRT